MAIGNVLDVFNSDAFGMVSMADGIDKITIQPSRIMGMGLFRPQSVSTTHVKIEERHGKLTLVPISARGTMPEFDTERVRNAKLFEVPHLPKNDTVWADDVDGVREFDSANKLETVSRIVADRLEQLKIDQEATWEWHAAKCLSGKTLDADGVEVTNWFTEFGITKKVVTIAFNDNGPKLAAMEIRRHIQDAIGGESFSGIHAFCNADFMDKFAVHTGVKEAYDRWQDGQFLRENQAYNFVDLFDIRWEEYRNVRTIDTGDATTNEDIPYIDHPSTPGLAVAYAFPLGTRNVFRRYNAPSPFVETVNTMGREIYVKQIRNEWDTGVQLHTSSNPLFIPQRPAALVEILIATS